MKKILQQIAVPAALLAAFASTQAHAEASLDGTPYDTLAAAAAPATVGASSTPALYNSGWDESFTTLSDALADVASDEYVQLSLLRDLDIDGVATVACGELALDGGDGAYTLTGRVKIDGSESEGQYVTFSGLKFGAGSVLDLSAKAADGVVEFQDVELDGPLTLVVGTPAASPVILLRGVDSFDVSDFSVDLPDGWELEINVIGYLAATHYVAQIGGQKFDSLDFALAFAQYIGADSITILDRSVLAEIPEGWVLSGDALVRPSATVTTAEGETTGFATLEDAIAAAAEGDTITLLADVTLENYQLLRKSVKIDGQAHTITGLGTSVFVLLSDNVRLELEDVTLVDRNTTDGAAGITVVGNGSSLVLDNVAIDCVRHALQVNPNVSADIAITDSTLSGYAALYLYGAADTKVVAANSTFDGVNNWNANAANNFATFMVWASDRTTVELTDCTVTGSSANGNVQIPFVISAGGGSASDNEIVVKGDKTVVAAPEGQPVGDVDSEGGNAIAISGGSFNAEVPEEFCADGFVPAAETVDGVVRYTVKAGSYVAAVGETKYETLSAAIAAAVDGDTVTLLADMEDGSGIAIPDGTKKSIVVDFGGHVYTMAKDPVGSAGYASQAMHFSQGSTLTLKNGTFKVAEGARITQIMQNYAALALVDFVLDAQSVIGGKYGNGYSGAYAVWNGRKIPVFNSNAGSISIVGASKILLADSEYIYIHKGQTGNYPGGATLEVSADENGNAPYVGGNLLFFTEEDSSSMVGPGYIAISAGTFANPVAEEFCAEGFIPAAETVDGVVRYTVKAGSYVAAVGETKYETLAAAIAAAVDGDTVTLLADVEGFSGTVNVAKSIVIDGDGHFVVAADDASGAQILDVTGGSVTLRDITLDGAHRYAYDVQVYGAGSLVLENATLLRAASASGLGDILYGAAVHVVGGSLLVKGDFVAYSGGKADKGFPFTGILYEGGSVAFEDGATASIANPAEGASADDTDLLLVGLVGALDVSTPEAKAEVQATLDAMNLPAGFGPYTLKIDPDNWNDNAAFTGASPLAWNDIIDYGKAIMDAIGMSTTETPVEVGLLADTEIPGTFLFEDSNFTVNGNGNRLSGTIEFTADSGVVTNVVFGAGSVLDVSAEGAAIRFAGDVAVAEGEKPVVVLGSLAPGQVIAANVGGLSADDFEFVVSDGQGGTAPLAEASLPEGYELVAKYDEETEEYDIVVAEISAELEAPVASAMRVDRRDGAAVLVVTVGNPKKGAWYRLVDSADKAPLSAEPVRAASAESVVVEAPLDESKPVLKFLIEATDDAAGFAGQP